MTHVTRPSVAADAWPMSRRTFLGLAGSAVALFAVRDSVAKPTREPPMSVGLQLYSVDAELKADFDGTLARVAAMGYRDVELPGFYGRSAASLKASLGKAGLRCRSTHVGPVSAHPATLSLASGLERTIDYCAELGVEYIVCPFVRLPPKVDAELRAAADAKARDRLFGDLTLDDWKAHAEFLNDVGRKVSDAGMSFAHHPHNLEYRPFGEVIALDEILRHTDPALVSIELDCGWVAAAGRDPAAELRRLGPRVTLAHFKDLTRRGVPNFALHMDSVECGKGIIDWPALVSAAHAIGLHQVYVEQEPPFVRSALESVKASLHFLKPLAG